MHWLRLGIKILKICFTTWIVLAATMKAQAFSEDRCSELFPKSGDAHRPYMAPIYSTTLAPSITSYFSSFGKCSMYGDDFSRKAFLENSYDHLLLDASRGGGEYLTALATLSGCSGEKVEEFSRAIQQNYKKIFPETRDVNATLDRINIVLRSNITLQNDCQTSS